MVLPQLDSFDRLVPPGIILDHAIELFGALADPLVDRQDRCVARDLVLRAGVEQHEPGKRRAARSSKHRNREDHLTVQGNGAPGASP